MPQLQPSDGGNLSCAGAAALYTVFGTECTSTGNADFFIPPRTKSPEPIEKNVHLCRPHEVHAQAVVAERQSWAFGVHKLSTLSNSRAAHTAYLHLIYQPTQLGA